MKDIDCKGFESSSFSQDSVIDGTTMAISVREKADLVLGHLYRPNFERSFPNIDNDDVYTPDIHTNIFFALSPHLQMVP